jgi:chemotaxis methyl-accepting protein methylase
MHPTQFAEICALLRGRTGHDFSQYKQATLMRRIRRRMQALGIATVPELILRLRNEPALIDSLFHELLIRRHPVYARSRRVHRLATDRVAADPGRQGVP